MSNSNDIFKNELTKELQGDIAALLQEKEGVTWEEIIAFTTGWSKAYKRNVESKKAVINDADFESIMTDLERTKESYMLLLNALAEYQQREKVLLDIIYKCHFYVEKVNNQLQGVNLPLYGLKLFQLLGQVRSSNESGHASTFPTMDQVNAINW